MRKRIISQDPPNVLPANQSWLDLQHLARVELTSEDMAYPIEAALKPGAESGWRASQTGEQTVRLIFDEPQRIRHMRLVFKEDEHERTQEFALRWSSDGGQSYREIVRQQYNFSSPDSTMECEDYTVELNNLTALELIITPDISGLSAYASLAQLCLA